ncbi:hypothetical protein [uncultured Tessaracoccus sp.]|uniref:hypothetical protein n=1 Tax=uncultured Tessaracoccus sp. TaxID=905023 RepID=UPI0026343F24|nr:hypothetical protein [uncultured Tessaracoccus sp.]
MRVRIGVAVALVCALTACAPGPGSNAEQTPPPAAPSASESEEPAEEPTPEPEPSEATPAEETSAPSESPAEPSPSESTTSSAPAPKSGWSVLDTKLSSASEVDALPVSAEIAHYLKSRLGEPCELEMTLFAAHSDGYLVADETGICDGAALFVYGPNDGDIEELVEFTAVPACSEFEKAGVPKGVPTSKLFPDGLACSTGSGTERY